MADTTKLQVMTLANLQKYDGLIKNYIDSACAVVDAKSIKTVALVGNKLCFYNVPEPVGTTTPIYEITLPETDISGLMEKLPANVAAGTVVVADGNGGVKAATFTEAQVALKSEVESAVAGVQGEVDAIKDDYLKAADKTELEGKIKVNTDAIAVLNGTGDGSVAKQVADAVAGIVNNAPEAYDTLKEISDWIEAHPESVSALNTAIQANADAISALETYVGTIPEDATAEDIVGYIGEVKTALEGKIATAKGEAIAAAAEDATTKANTAESNAKAYAKEYADAEVAKDRARLDAAEADIADIEKALAAGGDTAKAIAAAQAAAEAAQTTANEAKGQATTNAGAITDLTGRVAKNEEDIKGLQTELSKTNGNVTAVTETANKNKTDIEALQGKVETLEKSGYDDTQVKADIAKNAEDIAALKTKDNELAGNISKVEGNLASVTDRVAAVEPKVTALEGDMTTVKGDVSDLKTTVGTHGTDIEGLKGRATTLEGKVSTLEGEMDAVEKKAGDNASAITTLQGTVSSNSDRITALEANPVVEAIPDSEIQALFA